MFEFTGELKYAAVILKHKWFVIIAGRRLKVGWRQLLSHDLSKFSRAEWGPYKRRFVDNIFREYDWMPAWVHHQNHNPHHYEYWISRSQADPYLVDMPEKYIREIVADWLAASRSYEGRWPARDDWPWLKVNWQCVTRCMTTSTCALTKKVLSEAGLKIEEIKKENENG